MKKIIAAIAILMAFSFSANAQTSKMAPSTMETMPLKDHVCTAACKNGHHKYAHGEKGHKCSKKCMKMHKAMASTTMLKDHVCTAACKNGEHVYAHGEKGHVCTAECIKTI